MVRRVQARAHWSVRCTAFLIALGMTAAVAGQADLRTPPRGSFDHCRAAGWGEDPALNRLKNRALPVMQPRAMTVDAIRALPDPLLRHEARRYWPAPARAQIESDEARGVQVEGYVIGWNRERMEAGNCYRPDLGDLHLWIAALPNLPRSQAVIVELTPRWQSVRSNWTQAWLRDLERRRVRVRVRGWLMFDQAHPAEVGRTRATLWEVHPVTTLEIVPGPLRAQLPTPPVVAGNR